MSSGISRESCEEHRMYATDLSLSLQGREIISNRPWFQMKCNRCREAVREKERQ